VRLDGIKYAFPSLPQTPPSPLLSLCFLFSGIQDHSESLNKAVNTDAIPVQTGEILYLPTKPSAPDTG